VIAYITNLKFTKGDLAQNKTSVKQEFGAGLTTFLAMMYIVPVNAIIMSKTGMPYEALITATALITIFSTILNGLWANTPVAMSVGMGLNAYFTFGLCIGMKVPWQTALGVVFLSGVIFVVLSFTNFRMWIIRSIPLDLRRAISAGIGTFISFVAFQQMGFIVNWHRKFQRSKRASWRFGAIFGYLLLGMEDKGCVYPSCACYFSDSLGAWHRPSSNRNFLNSSLYLTDIFRA